MLNIMGDTQRYLNIDDYYTILDYGGRDSVGFTLHPGHEGYQSLCEETPIADTETGQRYLIKAIDEGGQTVTIKADLDLDELSADLRIAYNNQNADVLGTIAGVLPQGWSVQDHAHLSHTRVIELEAATPLEVISACYESYGIVCRFDNRARIVHIHNPESGEPQGAYLTDELNLTEMNMKGKSSDLATRLYVRGKDGMTFADLNDGKDYVDDHTYSDKIISAYWKDDRYTDKQALLEDARKNLALTAVPQQSYTCTILDLARARESLSGADENIYSFLEFELYLPVILIDSRRNRRVTHRVVQIKRYPKYPEKNEITLSTVAPSIQNTVRGVQQQIEKPTSTFNQIKQAEMQAATELITGARGGSYLVTTDPSTKKPNGWAIMDTDNTETAQNVWRMTSGGLGHSHSGFHGPYSDLALTMDGKINASMMTVGQINGDLIKAGRIQSYNGSVYFDLEANGGKGEIAASVLKGVEDGNQTTVRVGTGSWSDGTPYQGMRLYYPGGNGGSCVIAVDQATDFPFANQTEMVSLGDFVLRSQAIPTAPGGNNMIYLRGSDSGEGSVWVYRGTQSGSEPILLADEDRTTLSYKDNYINVRSDTFYLYHTDKIEFGTNGYIRASIESDGSARFGDLYSHGALITSDREKKTQIATVHLDALRAVKDLKFYSYQLLEPDSSFRAADKPASEAAKKEPAKPPERTPGRRVGIGILYDEAPESIRAENGDYKAIDLYAYISLLAKSVQELSAQVDELKREAQH